MSAAAALTPARGVAALCAAAALVLIVLPAPQDVPPRALDAAGLTVFAIGFWATAVLPAGVTAIIFFTLAMVIGVQPAQVVFSGFQSAALWLVFAGLVIGVSVRHTGLGERLARAIVGNLGSSYLAALSGIAVVGLALAFVMPSSMGRIALLLPIVLALADGLGFPAKSAGRTGMVMVASLISFIPAGTILPALVPGLILAGTADTLYGITISYGDYLITHFPVMGALRSVLIVLVTWRMFPDRPTPQALADPMEIAGPETAEPMTGRERLLAGLLLLALALWVTDSLHGISAGWIGLGAAAILLVPGLGLVPRNTLNKELDYNSLFYVAGVLAMGAVVAETGLASNVGGWLLGILPFAPGADAANFAKLAGLSAVLGLVVTNPGIPAVLSPLSGEIAAAAAMPLATVLMIQVVGFTSVILPYQAAPVVIGMQMGGVSMARGAKLTLVLTVLTALLLVPLNYLWWLVLGKF